MSDSQLSPVDLLGIDINVTEQAAAVAATLIESSNVEIPVNMDCATIPHVSVKNPIITSSSDSENDGELHNSSSGGHITSIGSSSASASNTQGSAVGRSSSPPPNCAICLGRCKDKCFTNSCMHQFCFKCLCEWSKVKPECPLCKQTFNSIIHNVKSDNQFEEYHVQQPTVQIPQGPIVDYRNHLPYLVDGVLVNGPQIRSYNDWSSWRVTGAEVLETYRRMYPRLSITEATTGGSEILRMFPEGIPQGNQTQLWRKYVYERRLYAMPVTDITGRFRESSARFYRENPAQVHRLMPWINRDIVCLLHNTSHDVTTVMNQINEDISMINILSPSFRRRLQPYLGSKTSHFIHELNNFARAPYDMIGYDRTVQYSRYISEEIVIGFSSSSNTDSDENDGDVDNTNADSAPIRRSRRRVHNSDYFRVQQRSINQTTQAPLVNLLAFTISTTSEGGEAPGVTVAVTGSRGTQSTAINLTTHNRASGLIINLDDVEATNATSAAGEQSNNGNTIASGSSSGGTDGVSDGSTTSTNNENSTTSNDNENNSYRTNSTQTNYGTAEAVPVPVENIELCTSSSSDECEFVLERKPPHLRTPEMVSLNSESDSDVVFVDEIKPVKPKLPPITAEASYSTSSDDDGIDAPAHCTRQCTVIKNESPYLRNNRPFLRYRVGQDLNDGPSCSRRRPKRRAVRNQHNDYTKRARLSSSSSFSLSFSSDESIESFKKKSKSKIKQNGKRNTSSTNKKKPTKKVTSKRPKKNTGRKRKLEQSKVKNLLAPFSQTTNVEESKVNSSCEMSSNENTVLESPKVSLDSSPSKSQNQSNDSLNLTNTIRKIQTSLRRNKYVNFSPNNSTVFDTEQPSTSSAAAAALIERLQNTSQIQTSLSSNDSWASSRAATESGSATTISKSSNASSTTSSSQSNLSSPRTDNENNDDVDVGLHSDTYIVDDNGHELSNSSESAVNVSNNVNFYNLNVSMEEVLNSPADLPSIELSNLDSEAIEPLNNLTTAEGQPDAEATVNVESEESVSAAFRKTAKAYTEATATLTTFGIKEMQVRKSRSCITTPAKTYSDAEDDDACNDHNADGKNVDDDNTNEHGNDHDEYDDDNNENDNTNDDKDNDKNDGEEERCDDIDNAKQNEGTNESSCHEEGDIDVDVDNEHFDLINNPHIDDAVDVDEFDSDV